jgi:ATP-dependent 26S proteasome regulatory subunit
MSPSGVILYGPPGAGKDTITAELSRLRPEFTLFQRLKAGPRANHRVSADHSAAHRGTDTGRRGSVPK